ncbi:MAG: hemin-degrading factor, partial [Rubricoccaceae bacterium]
MADAPMADAPMTDTLAARTDRLADLRERFAAYRADHPTARIRTAAADLGTSEAALVATGVDGPAVALAAPAGGWRALLPELEALGDVMALTRNDAAVHERHGVYRRVETDLPHGMAQVLGDEIDLRLFCARWAGAYAVETPTRDGRRRRSVQFFDRSGDAVHKTFLTDASDEAAFDALVRRHRAPTPLAPPAAPRVAPAPERPDADIDREALLAGWAALEDTHDFIHLLSTHRVGRVQALRLAEGRFTERVPGAAVRGVLEAAAAGAIPVMIFVGNPGAIQIHSGPVERLAEAGPWFNVLDARFNLHLNETQIADAFVVVKPTVDGDVTAVEAYDAAGQAIVQLFGLRKPGLAERADWRAAVAGLPRATAGSAA